MNGLESLQIGTINGLKSLTLDTLTTNDLNADQIFLRNIETLDILIDNNIIMGATSNILSNGKTISNIEISYLDNVSSNIQTQINNTDSKITTLIIDVSNNSLQIETLIADVNNNSNNIVNLQLDISNNISNVETLIVDVSNNTNNIAILTDNTNGFYNNTNYIGLSRSILGINDGLSINLSGENCKFELGRFSSIQLNAGCNIRFNGIYQNRAFSEEYYNTIVNSQQKLTNIEYDSNYNKTSINNSCYIQLLSCGNFNSNFLSGLTSNIQHQTSTIAEQLSFVQTKTTNLNYTGDSTFISGILETNHISTQQIEFPIDNTSQYSAFTNEYKSQLDILAQPAIIYNYYNVFTATETEQNTGSFQFNSLPSAKLIDTTGNTKMFANAIYCISATINVENLKYLKQFGNTIRLLGGSNSTFITESQSTQINRVIFNGASGAEFNNYTLVCAPYYFKCLANYNDNIRIQYNIVHSMDSINGTTIKFTANANLIQVN